MSEVNAVFDTVQSSPILWGAFLAILIILGYLQTKLGPEDDWVETLREKWWFKIDEALSELGGYAVIMKGKKEYVFTVEAKEEKIEEILYRGGYHRNPIASKKVRIEPGGGKISSLSSWVNRKSLLSEMQDHATVFPGHKSGTVDIYHHYETSWISHPYKHYADVEQIDGDPQGTLENALMQSDVVFYFDEEWSSEF